MSSSEECITYDLDLLDESARSWKSSLGLRCIYQDLYFAIRSECLQYADGLNLEIGSGIGVSREFISNVVTSDIVKTPYVDCAMSAYEITPCDGQLWVNVFAVDVLHHLMTPLKFLQSASEALQPEGRLVLMEPAATLFGRVFYKLFHHEPIAPQQLLVEDFVYESNGPDGEFANMGMGVALFRLSVDELKERLEQFGLRLVKIQYRDLFAYPLTGGYSKPQLLPTWALKVLLSFERCLPQWLMKYLGLRMMIVLERVE